MCDCGREDVAARPPGLPDAAVSIDPNLRAMAVYLLIFQHMPIERCQQLISDVAGAADGPHHASGGDCLR